MGNLSENKIPDTLSLSGGWEGHIYRHWNFPPEVIQSWRRLARDYGDAGVFLSDGWFENWWNAFGKQETLLIVVFIKEGEIKAIFPCRLASVSNGARERRLVGSLTNDHTCHYDFLIDQEFQEEVLVQFVTVLRQITSDEDLLFEYLPLASRNVGLLMSVLHHERTPVHWHHGPWAPWLELPGDWEQFVDSLPGRLRNTLKRCRKKTEAKGKVEFETIRESKQLNERLDEFFKIEHRSWKGQEGSAIKSDANVEQFYRTLAHWAMGEHCLLLFFLKLDGLPIAGSLCLSSGKTVFLLKPGYDESFSMLSPGSLLQAEVLKYLSAMPDVAHYNFLGACDDWKMEWRSSASQVGCMKVYARSVKGWSRYCVEYGWKNMLNRIGIFQSVKRSMDL